MKIEDLNISCCLESRINNAIIEITGKQENIGDCQFILKHSKEIEDKIDFEYKAEFIELIKTLK